jgi:hypothetical protein
MYIDSVVMSGLLIVLLSCTIITFVGIYAYKHIKQDSIKADKTNNLK